MKSNLFDFGQLHKIISNRDVQYIRQVKDEIECWSYLSVWFVFHPDELRQFADYIDWDLFVQTPDMVKQYRRDQLEEFMYLLSPEAENYLNALWSVNESNYR